MIIKNENKFHFITGGTGTGKSWKIINKTLNLFTDQKEDHNKTVIIALPNLKIVDVFVERYKSSLSLSDMKKICVYTAGSTQKDSLINKIQKNKGEIPKIIITTHAYLHKRGHSDLIYPLFLDLLWLQKEKNRNLELYCDESHTYFDSLVWTLKTKGLYEEFDEIGGGVYLQPIEHLNLNNENENLYKYCSTKYRYKKDKASKNPFFTPVHYDLDDKRIFEIQTLFDLRKSKFLTKNNPIRVTRGDFFDMSYTYYENPTFSYADLLIKGLSIAKRKHNNSTKAYVDSFCKNHNIEQKVIADLDFKTDFNLLLNTSAYIVECKNESTNFLTSNPQATHISGLNYGGIALLDSFFSKITWVSASFREDHFLIFKYIDSNFEYEIEDLNFNPEKNRTSRMDYGVVLFTKKEITNKKINNILTNLGPLIYFCSTISKSKQLENKLKKDETFNLNNRYVRYEKDYGHDSTTAFNREFFFTSDINTKDLIISYWNSTLSSGIDLSALDVLIVDHRAHVPFVFIPFFDKIDKNVINEYIEKQINETILQIVGRITRGKNNKPKIIIITHYYGKGLNSNQDYYLDRLHKFLNHPTAVQKFEKFEKYYDVDFDDLTCNFLVNQKKAYQTEEFVFNPSAKSIKDNLLKYAFSIENKKETSNLISRVTDRDFKRLLQEKIKEQTEYQNYVTNFNVFVSMDISLTSKTVFICIKNHEEDTQVIKIIDNKSISQFKIIFNKLSSTSLNFIYFSSKNLEPIVINYFLESNLSLPFNEIFSNLLVTLRKRNVSLPVFKYSNIILINLRKLLLPRVTINITKLAPFLDIPVTSANNFKNDLSYNTMILSYLYKELFSDEKLKRYQNYLRFLERNGGWHYSSKEEFSYFCSNINQKWLNPILDKLTKSNETLLILDLKKNSKNLMANMISNHLDWSNAASSTLRKYMKQENNAYSFYFKKEYPDVAFKNSDEIFNYESFDVNPEQKNNCFIFEIEISNLIVALITKWQMLSFFNEKLTQIFEKFIEKRYSLNLISETKNDKTFFYVVDAILIYFNENKKNLPVDLIKQFNQDLKIVYLNLIDFLKSKNVKIFCVQETSFIAVFNEKNGINLLNGWEKKHSIQIPLKYTPLINFRVTSNKIFKNEKTKKKENFKLENKIEIEKRNSFKLT